jgi:hypothetical protein
MNKQGRREGRKQEMDIMYFWWANSWKLTKPMMLDQPKRKWLKWYRTRWIGKHKKKRSIQARTPPPPLWFTPSGTGLSSFLPEWRNSPLVGQCLHIIEASLSHLDTPHSIGLLWNSYQLAAEICTWTHTALTRDRRPCPRRNSNPQSQQTRGHRPTP